MRVWTVSHSNHNWLYFSPTRSCQSLPAWWSSLLGKFPLPSLRNLITWNLGKTCPQIISLKFPKDKTLHLWELRGLFGRWENWGENWDVSPCSAVIHCRTRSRRWPPPCRAPLLTPRQRGSQPPWGREGSSSWKHKKCVLSDMHCEVSIQQNSYLRLIIENIKMSIWWDKMLPSLTFLMKFKTS